jgi:hypothetical protein
MTLGFVVTAVKVLVKEVWIHLSEHCLCEHQTINTSLIYRVELDIAVGIASRYRLDGPGIQSWWERDFPYPSGPALGPNQPPIQCIPGRSRVKATGAWR